MFSLLSCSFLQKSVKEACKIFVMFCNLKGLDPFLKLLYISNSVFRNQTFIAFYWSTFEIGLHFSYYCCVTNDPSPSGLKQTFNFSHNLQRTVRVALAWCLLCVALEVDWGCNYLKIQPVWTSKISCCYGSQLMLSDPNVADCWMEAVCRSIM